MSQIVYDKDGKAGILTGLNHEGAETVIWLGTPEIIVNDIDEFGNGEPPYSTSVPAPEGSGRGYVDGTGAPAAAPSTPPTPSPLSGATVSPGVSTPAANATDNATYTDNHDGTYTRDSDGARGSFGPNGFTVKESAPDVVPADAKPHEF